MNGSYSFPPPPAPAPSPYEGGYQCSKRPFQCLSPGVSGIRRSQSPGAVSFTPGPAKRARTPRHDADRTGASEEHTHRSLSSTADNKTNSDSKITLPPFREAFEFALNDANELQVEDRTCGEQGRCRRGLFPPPPLKMFRAPAEVREEIPLTFKTASTSRYPARYSRNSGGRYNMANVNSVDMQFASPGRSSEYGAKCTIASSSGASEYSSRKDSRKDSPPISINPSTYSSRSHGRHSVQYRVLNTEYSPISTPSVPKTYGRLYDDVDTDQMYDDRRGRLGSQLYSASPPSGPSTCSYRSSSTSFDSASEISTRTSVTPDSPRTDAPSRRPRPSTATGQPWETHALELESPRNYYRCLWEEDKIQCHYHAKKQAMKRHVELTHLKYRPHKCGLCDKSYGQRTSLEVHLATHTGDKDHVCPEPECPKAFSDASRLLRHRTKVHDYQVRRTAPKFRYRKPRSPTTPTPKRRSGTSATKTKERAGPRKRTKLPG